MEDDVRKEAIILGCTLCGLVLGMAIRQRRHKGEIDLPKAVGTSLPSMMAAAGIAQRMGDALGFAKTDQKPRAAVAFATAAALTYFADSLGRHMPGVDFAPTSSGAA